jgi:hypothetical protein
MDTPVALIIFNRPAATARVLEQIALARPKTLLVIADGPRPDRVGEAAACAATRALIERVDWACEVVTHYSDVNLGVGVRPATGLRWVFTQVQEAIVLEDDCVPHPSFFPFCQELLERYRDDERVMHISGDNWGFTTRPEPHSYFFSTYCYSCGWATWRRAFQHYDPQLTLWPALRDTPWMFDLLGDREAVEFWQEKFDLVHRDGIARHGWDWPWLFACWAHRGLSILPSVNLITNIGFGQDATHTTRADDERAFVPAVEMRFPLGHPPHLTRHVDADRRIVEQVGLVRQPTDLPHRLRRVCVDALPQPLRRSLASMRSALVARRAS